MKAKMNLMPCSAAKKSAGSDSDDAVFDLSNVAPARDRPGRAKKAVNYQNFDDGSDDEDF